MTDVAYELAIIGGELSDDESAALGQVEKIKMIAQRCGGDVAGPWEYHFPNFEAARQAEREFRQMALTFESIQIKAIDGSTGKDLPS